MLPVAVSLAIVKTVYKLVNVCCNVDAMSVCKRDKLGLYFSLGKLHK